MIMVYMHICMLYSLICFQALWPVCIFGLGGRSVFCLLWPVYVGLGGWYMFRPWWQMYMFGLGGWSVFWLLWPVYVVFHG